MFCACCSLLFSRRRYRYTITATTTTRAPKPTTDPSMSLVVQVELTVFGGKVFVVALAPAGEGIRAVVLVIDELFVEIGLVVEVENVEVDIALPYWSTVTSVMLKNVL
jgi:hypothetical protein